MSAANNLKEVLITFGYGAAMVGCMVLALVVFGLVAAFLCDQPSTPMWAKASGGVITAVAVILLIGWLVRA